MYVGKFAKPKRLNSKLRLIEMHGLSCEGQIAVNSHKANAGDGLAIEKESALKIASEKDTEFILLICHKYGI